MANISGRLAAIKPQVVYSYVDSIQLWVPRWRLAAACIARLRKLCSPRKVHVFERGDWARLQVRLPPSDKALVVLSELASINSAILNKVEMSLDWVFANEFDLDAAEAAFNQYSVKKYHREEHGVHFVGATRTRYTGRDWRQSSNLVSYGDKNCRATGEPNCLHIEWRVFRIGNLKNLGIESISDLIHFIRFRQYQFWQERLLLYDVDRERLGLTLHNFENREQQRRIANEDDYRRGRMLLRAYGSTQELLDAHSGLLRSYIRNTCLQRLEVEHLLPKKRG